MVCDAEVWLTAGLQVSTMPLRFGQVAQLVEQRTENPRVGGSIPSLATSRIKELRPPIGGRFHLLTLSLTHSIAKFFFACFPFSRARGDKYSRRYDRRAKEFSVAAGGLVDGVGLSPLEFREVVRRNCKRVLLERPLPDSNDLAVHDNRRK